MQRSRIRTLLLFLAGVLPAGGALAQATSPASRPAASRPAATVQRTTPFDDLLRFVPAGLESLLCFDLRRADAPPSLVRAMREGMLLPMVEHAADSEHLLRGVWCAGKFRLQPQSLGDYEGVFVSEYATRVAPPLDTRPAPPDVRRERIAGREVFREPDDIAFPLLGPESRIARIGPLEVWHTFLDDRTVLTATRRHLLVAALRGDGEDGASRARNCGFPEVAWDVPLILLRRYDPDCASDQVTPLRTGGFIGVGNGPRAFRFAIRAVHGQILGGPTLVFVGRTLGADTDVAREEFAGLFHQWPRRAEPLPDGGFRLQLQYEARDAARFELGLINGFGFNFMN